MTMLENAHRKIKAIVRRGRVKFVNDGGVVQIMQVLLNGLETPDNRLRVAEFGFTSNPPEDSDVIALHLDGEMSAGVVLGTNHQPSRPTGLKSGETILYSEDGKQIYLTAGGGIVVNANNQAVTVNGATTVTINAATEVLMNTPILKVSGDIIDNFGTNPHSMAQMRTIYDTHTHPVPNVQVGGPGATTSGPNQTE